MDRVIMRSAAWSKFAALSGVLGAVLTLIVVLIAGFIQPEYSHRTDFISELNTDGSKHSVLIGYLGFIPIGFFGLLFIW